MAAAMASGAWAAFTAASAAEAARREGKPPSEEFDAVAARWLGYSKK